MKKCLVLLLLALTLQATRAQSSAPKREFRGAWIQCVNGQFEGLTPEAMRQKLTAHLDALARIHVNTIFFQVRPEADALYHSTMEPWSRFLTGTQGVAPQPEWDPLQWMITEAHKRNMELHAWINPYRAKTARTHQLAATHPYNQHPERFFHYGDQIIFRPELAINRQHIVNVVQDILTHYDVDGIHMDDYFYPYPISGVDIPDSDAFKADPRGFSNIADWRRDNVNLLIRDLHNAIRKQKPWVRFGVSPFGIYHNKQRGPEVPGSDTNGLENYIALYADVLKWVNEGWVDYNLPQLYWNIGFKVADYDVLARFWAQYSSNRPLYFGQDITRSMKAADPTDPTQSQLPAKLRLQRQLGAQGSCIWYSAVIADNFGGVTDYLAKSYYRYPALLPKMPFIDNRAPKKVKGLKIKQIEGNPMLIWLPREGKGEMDKAVKYVVYRFADGEKPNLDDPSKIYLITDQTCIKLPYKDGSQRYTYCVTALDRLQNESKAKSKKVKL